MVVVQDMEVLDNDVIDDFIDWIIFLVLTDALFNIDIIAPLSIPLASYPCLIVPIAGISPSLSSTKIFDSCGIWSRIYPICSSPV